LVFFTMHMMQVWMCFAAYYVLFFFQAEDGIRDATVTGVQTCALPIWPPQVHRFKVDPGTGVPAAAGSGAVLNPMAIAADARNVRSEERRCRERGKNLVVAVLIITIANRNKYLGILNIHINHR